MPEMPQSSNVPSESSPLMRKIGYFLGPILFTLTFFFAPPETMSIQGWHVCALALWMATWWITEAMPLPVTSLLPIVILPIFEIMPMKAAVAPFASPIIFLFLGGFMLSIAMEKWNLHLRIGLGLVKSIGTGSKSILAGVMISTAFMGMWMSNTATVIMMLPMAVSIAGLLSHKPGDAAPALGENNFAKALILGVAYSAVIGGLATFVGSPVNAVLQSTMLKTYNHGFTLADWMMFGIPLAAILLALTWYLLVARFMKHAQVCDDVRGVVHSAFAKLGPMCREEKIVLFVFSIMVALWVFSKQLEHFTHIVIDDSVVAVFGGILLFLIPANKGFTNFALNWKDTTKLQWGILVFFGGSLALSDALSDTGVTLWLSGQLQTMQHMDIILITTIVVVMLILVTEFMSNVATITAFLPILIALADAVHINPLVILIPATLAASTGFALPGASAPNALAYSTGHLRMRDMLFTGFILDIFCLIAIIVCMFTLTSWVFGIDLGVLPEWAARTTK